MSDQIDLKFNEVISDIDIKLSNSKEDHDIFDSKLKDYLENLTKDNDKDKIKEITRTRLSFLKSHIESKIQLSSKEDNDDKTRLLESIDEYLGNFEEASNEASKYFDELKTYSENKDEEWKVDEKKNAAWEEMESPLKLLDVPVFRKYFLKSLEFLNKTFGWLFWSNFTESITRSVNNHLSLTHLKESSKKWEIHESLKDFDFTEIKSSELKPFFWFFEEIWIDVTTKDFWKNYFDWNLEFNWVKIKLPERKWKKITDKFEDLNELYIFLNSIEDANPDFLKKQKEVTAWFSKKLDWKDTSFYYRQYDPEWWYINYGWKSMAASACWPTSFAMVASMLRWEKILPPDVAKWSLNNWHRVPWRWTDWAFMSDACSHFWIKRPDELWRNQERLLASLPNWPVIASMWPGKFTSGWHYIVLAWLSDDWKRIKVLDPGRESRNGEYDISLIMSQAKNFWAYSA